jgi:Holliday junction resolvase RusA-like endonuclease
MLLVTKLTVWFMDEQITHLVEKEKRKKKKEEVQIRL